MVHGRCPHPTQSISASVAVDLLPPIPYGPVSHTCIPGSIENVVELIETIDPSSVLVFAGGRSYETSGAADMIDRAVDGRLVSFVRIVPPDPTAGDVADAIGIFRSKSPDLVIAIGGGSVIDLAKAVRSIGPVSADPLPFLLGDRVVGAGGPPLLAVPTTAGTGSEATRYAVFTVDGEKRPIGHPALIPEHVILDPELTYSPPPAVTASTGLDALAQAMESMWSTRSTDASYADARAALRFALEHLEPAVNRPDPTSRAGMCTAAHLSGRAIDVSATTAPHALSFHLSTVYGVPHGHAVALTLGPVLEYNASVRDGDCADPRGPDHVRTVISDVLDVIGVATPAQARERLTELVEAIGLDPTLAAAGVETPEQSRALTRSASTITLATHPRPFDDESLLAIDEGIP